MTSERPFMNSYMLKIRHYSYAKPLIISCLHVIWIVESLFWSFSEKKFCNLIKNNYLCNRFKEIIYSGYRPVPPEHEQYIRQAARKFGWKEPLEFNGYVEDYQLTIFTIYCDFSLSVQIFFLSLQRNHNILWIWLKTIWIQKR